MLIDADAFQRVLGEELRKLRRQRGWTRKELNERLQSDISLQTLATYELGTRHCSVVRLVELCMALGEPPQDLLARVHRRVFGDDPGQVRVNLAGVVADDSPGLAPLRRWAEDRLKQSNTPEIQLDRSAVERMAELCRMPTAQLLAKLAELSSNPGTGERTDTGGGRT
ncbi:MULTISPECIES: helix-turn-helix domain-containing protein [Prauserella salsuginis group]|uniref:Helix-turn-helix domain-containing protein n=1 Tax=Prauserella salsuginis TaxID=387889 RepID=A0ABW6G5W0_9PSEU|nr:MULTISPECIES: helix-turn-helix transcriptional regulator [Prauserella salsuginis group]MCR3719215.1 Helix-turn-helix domain-containing protein [Prauserella flava]MCR3735772.1 Helix-turn-helix domain-containing protein [Prauserella salsuginis]